MQRPETHTKLGWYFPNEMVEKFREGAAKRGYNMSALIRMAIEGYNDKWAEEDAEGERV